MNQLAEKTRHIEQTKHHKRSKIPKQYLLQTRRSGLRPTCLFSLKLAAVMMTWQTGEFISKRLTGESEESRREAPLKGPKHGLVLHGQTPSLLPRLYSVPEVLCSAQMQLCKLSHAVILFLEKTGLLLAALPNKPDLYGLTLGWICWDIHSWGDCGKRSKPTN